MSVLGLVSAPLADAATVSPFGGEKIVSRCSGGSAAVWNSSRGGNATAVVVAGTLRMFVYCPSDQKVHYRERALTGSSSPVDQVTPFSYVTSVVDDGNAVYAWVGDSTAGTSAVVKRDLATGSFSTLFTLDNEANGVVAAHQGHWAAMWTQLNKFTEQLWGITDRTQPQAVTPDRDAGAVDYMAPTLTYSGARPVFFAEESADSNGGDYSLIRGKYGSGHWSFRMFRRAVGGTRSQQLTDPDTAAANGVIYVVWAKSNGTMAVADNSSGRFRSRTFTQAWTRGLPTLPQIMVTGRHVVLGWYASGDSGRNHVVVARTLGPSTTARSWGKRLVTPTRSDRRLETLSHIRAKAVVLYEGPRYHAVKVQQ